MVMHVLVLVTAAAHLPAYQYVGIYFFQLVYKLSRIDPSEELDIHFWLLSRSKHWEN